MGAAATPRALEATAAAYLASAARLRQLLTLEGDLPPDVVEALAARSLALEVLAATYATRAFLRRTLPGRLAPDQPAPPSARLGLVALKETAWALAPAARALRASRRLGRTSAASDACPP